MAYPSNLTNYWWQCSKIASTYTTRFSNFTQLFSDTARMYYNNTYVGMLNYSRCTDNEVLSLCNSYTSSFTHGINFRYDKTTNACVGNDTWISGLDLLNLKILLQ